MESKNLTEGWSKCLRTEILERVDWAGRTPNQLIALIDGVETLYDMATVDKEDIPNFTYLGSGVIHSVNGVIQKNSSVTTRHFWKRNESF